MARPGLMNHPKFRRLVLQLGLPVAHTRGLLELLWETAYECGDPFIGDSTDVELAAGWTGQPGELTSALLTCGGSRSGFIETANDDRTGYRIHDLWHHAPDYVQKRRRRELARRTRGDDDHLSSATGLQCPDNGGQCPPLNGQQSPKVTVDHHTRARSGHTPAPSPAPSSNTLGTSIGGGPTESEPVREADPGPPSLAEALTYAKEKGLKADPRGFIAHYKARGWKVNGFPITDWRALYDSWEAKEGRFNAKRSSKGPKKAGEVAAILLAGKPEPWDGKTCQQCGKASERVLCRECFGREPGVSAADVEVEYGPEKEPWEEEQDASPTP